MAEEFEHYQGQYSGEQIDEAIRFYLGGGATGNNGKSAYEIAVDNGYIGTEAEWITSLKGAAGNDGVGIKSVVQTTTSTADAGENVITITLTNNQTISLITRNGSGGAAGYSPIKGIDYYTQADKEELVQLVLAAIPNGDEVSY